MITETNGALRTGQFIQAKEPGVGVFKNDEVSKIDDPGIVSHGFDLAESKYGG